MNVIWLLLKASWINVAIAILTGLVSGGCNAQLIALINRAIGSQFQEDLLKEFVVVALVALVTSVISQVLLFKLVQNTVYNLRLTLSRRILSAPLRHLEELGVNRLLATLTEDVQSLSAAVSVVPFVCINAAIIIGCLAYLRILSTQTFWVTVVLMLMAIVTVQLMLNRGYRFLSLARQEDDRLFKHFHTITDGIKELKLHGDRRQEFLTDELQVSAGASRQYNLTALNIFAITSGWGNLVFFAIVGLLLFGLPRFIAITPATLSAYILTITYLISPFQGILQALPGLLSASVSLRKIEQMGLALSSQTEQLTPMLKPSFELQWSKLELRHLTHTYRGETEDSRFTLGELNLTFQPQQIIFIVGGNGSGKSTLAKLLTGLYIPEVGELRLDDQPITDTNREWYRQYFSAIFSDFYLFDRLLGIRHPNLDEHAQDYLQQLNLDRKVRIENGTLSTTALSQGQRKRLALLTAYLEDRPIYLFDEWASDQDPHFRDIFYKQLLPELRQRGKTVFVISHDDRYFHVADRIIKLDYGKIESDQT